MFHLRNFITLTETKAKKGYHINCIAGLYFGDEKVNKTQANKQVDQSILQVTNGAFQTQRNGRRGRESGK